MSKKLFFAFIYFTSQMSHAAESLSTKIHNQYQSLRAMGMGNAFTTVSDDYSALMYNPAALALKKRGEIQFSLAGAAFAPNTMNLAKDVSDAEKSTTDETGKIIAISDALDKYYGKQLGGRVQAAEIFWVRPKWGIAILPLDLSLDLSVNKQFGPALDMNVKKDTTIAFGYGTEVYKDIYAGATLKGIHRDSIEQTVPATEFATNSNILNEERFQEGIAFTTEIGFLWVPTFKKTIKKISQPQEEKTEDLQVELKPTESKPSELEKEILDLEKTKTPENKNSDSVPQSQDATRTVQSEPTSMDPSQPAVQTTDLTPAETNPTALPEVVKEASQENNNAELKKVDTTTDQKEKTTQKTKKVTPSVSEETTESDEISKPLSVSFVARNGLSTKFSKSTMINKKATEAPSDLKFTADVGAGYNILSWGDLILRSTVEYKNMFHTFSTLKKSSHVGLELDYSPGTWFETQFRVGLNQMYYTAGLTLLLGVLEIDAVTYGEEVGTSSTSIENRVYAAKIGFNF